MTKETNKTKDVRGVKVGHLGSLQVRTLHNQFYLYNSDNTFIRFAKNKVVKRGLIKLS